MLIGRRNRARHGRRPVFPIRFLASACLAALLALGAAEPGHAREPGGQRDSAALLQSARPLRIAVVGDSVAGDLARGLLKLLRGRDNLKVLKFTKPATGLMRDDVYDWRGALRGFVGKNRLDVIAVMIGGNDRQSIWMHGHRLTLGSPAWRAEYERRVARFMAILKTEKARVYWIGLPVVRSDAMSRDYRMLNGIYRAQAGKHGFAYVSIWEAFADARGRYTSFGRGVDGVKRRLRKKDGKHFTIAGELLLAHLVARAIDRDLGERESAN